MKATKKRKKGKKVRAALRKITIRLRNGRLEYELRTNNGNPVNGKKAHMNRGDDIFWRGSNVDAAGLFKDGASPIGQQGFFVASGNNTTTFPVNGSPDAYRYFVAAVVDDQILIDDPEIIIDL